MSYKHLHRVWKRSPTTRAARAVLNVLAARADQATASLWSSELTIADQAGVSDRTVRRALRFARNFSVDTYPLSMVHAAS